MRRIFVDSISGGMHTLRGDEHKHLFVLRAKVGDKLEICCGDGFVNICKIESVNKEQTVVKVVERRKDDSEASIVCDLFVGIIKGEHMEIAVQKCVELGVNSVNPIITENTVKTDLNIARLQKISLEAAKQSGRGKIPKVYSPQKISDIYDALSGYDAIVFPYEKAESIGLFEFLNGLILTNRGDKGMASLRGFASGVDGCDAKDCNESVFRLAIIVGSEGGFAADEVEKLSALTTPVTLGVRILRADTACISTLTAIMLVFGQLE